MFNAELFFKKYYKSLCYFAYTFLKISEDAEDVVRSCFLVYLGREDELKLEEKQIISYLYSSIRNQCLNKIRHQKIVHQYEQNHQLDDKENEQIILRMIQSEVLHILNGKINHLPSACRHIMKLSYLDGLSNKEISDLLGISINTIKTQKTRGIQYLRKVLTPEMFALFLTFLFKK